MVVAAVEGGLAVVGTGVSEVRDAAVGSAGLSASGGTASGGTARGALPGGGATWSARDGGMREAPD
ncbi:MAG: hypothetical protein ACRDZX_08230, partial [Acidimicrobiales bacterium]